MLHLIALLPQNVQYTMIPQEMTCSIQEIRSSHVNEDRFKVGVPCANLKRKQISAYSHGETLSQEPSVSLVLDLEVHLLLQE